jgi:hypothetical protein
MLGSPVSLLFNDISLDFVSNGCGCNIPLF